LGAIYAHHNQRSFCHAVLERFCAGLKDAGHSNEVIDLHAIGFDPVFRDRDGPNWIDDSVPDDVLANMNVEKSLNAGQVIIGVRGLLFAGAETNEGEGFGRMHRAESRRKCRGNQEKIDVATD